MTITGVDVDDINKFVKPLGTQVHLDDDIIYTKPDSKHYGCKGVVKSYNIEDDKFSVEIKAKDGSIKKLTTKDENLEFVPPLRKFKKGDRVRYINSENQYDGLIGTVNLVNAGETKNPSYNIILKNDQGNSIYLTTYAENIMLLEEVDDSVEFKIGQPVKYTFAGSKHDGKIGKYDGERIKDGKRQLCVKFDDGASFIRLWVDDGTLESAGEAPTYTTTTTTYGKKKKKSKEPEEERKPVLVYNRRNIAKKAYVPPDTKPTEEAEEHKE
jgi:hypothetical protein